MPFWSNARLNAKITKGNVCDIPDISNLGEPLTFTWCVLLERQSLNRAKLIAIGKGHLNFRLAKVNHWDILLSPEVFFYLNHAYTIKEKMGFVKKNFQLFYCTILRSPRESPKSPTTRWKI